VQLVAAAAVAADFNTALPTLLRQALQYLYLWAQVARLIRLAAIQLSGQLQQTAAAQVQTTARQVVTVHPAVELAETAVLAMAALEQAVKATMAAVQVV
jgi:hypothetical protein